MTETAELKLEALRKFVRANIELEKSHLENAHFEHSREKCKIILYEYEKIMEILK